VKLQHYGVLQCVPLFPLHTSSSSSAVKDEVPHTHTHTSTIQNCVSVLGEQNNGTLRIQSFVKGL